VQWLDSVWQMLRQAPDAFEYNEDLLLFVADALYSGRFGTFFCNTAAERDGMELQRRTVSLWTHVMSSSGEFVNPRYSSHPGPLWPSSLPKRIVLWERLLLRWDPEAWADLERCD
jgi:hypothetical protein